LFGWRRAWINTHDDAIRPVSTGRLPIFKEQIAGEDQPISQTGAGSAGVLEGHIVGAFDQANDCRWPGVILIL